MAIEEEHKKPEDMVEIPGEAEQAARSLEESVDSHGTLQGYYAMNETPPPPEVEKQLDEQSRKGDNKP